ncbi:ArsR family transcriptional regulator [Jannaschia pagri]|uniref:ArsR family transcriptional regulator n=1 Tax=Jannaschia pagri TaxID=2829797 RepID=A0ABQ4NRG0_9RHOB|nr:MULTISPECIES: Lrp/AsnC family transcriptional regulator [unclassified Jannaschia]GIT92837.1 ArsR family transcriptional regulator [Jannaschia sp. AI_61]GIT96672.1 ArsR family transcriptional regulator [Jannaschia sp. AI_62]
MVDIDETDRRILRVLQKDTTLSLDALADMVALSRNACWRRVRRMEEAGIITARVAHLNASALGLGLTVFVMIRAGAHDPDWLSRFQAAIAAMPEIQGAHRMTGDLDYVLRVRVEDVAGYDRFYKALIARVPVADVSASFVMEDIKDTTELPI